MTQTNTTDVSVRDKDLTKQYVIMYPNVLGLAEARPEHIYKRVVLVHAGPGVVATAMPDDKLYCEQFLSPGSESSQLITCSRGDVYRLATAEEIKSTLSIKGQLQDVDTEVRSATNRLKGALMQAERTIDDLCEYEANMSTL